MVVDRDNVVNAMATAYQYAKYYRQNRKPNISMILGEKYNVHHTKSGSIIIKQISHDKD